MGDKLSRWFGVFTNLGLITGLVLVAYQIEQANSSLDLQRDQWLTEFRVDRYNLFSDIMLQIAADEGISEIWDKGIRGVRVDRHRTSPL